MGATNETSTIRLPEYIATDKPSYLGDWNSAMAAIDGAIAQDRNDLSTIQANLAATTAASTQNTSGLAAVRSDVTGLGDRITGAETKADNASSAASTAQTAANNAQTAADNAASAASTAQSDATSACRAASAAQTAADTAGSDAFAAHQAADNAQTAANNAQAAADAAQADADGAQSAAVAAQATADAAKEWADADKDGWSARTVTLVEGWQPVTWPGAPDTTLKVWANKRLGKIKITGCVWHEPAATASGNAQVAKFYVWDELLPSETKWLQAGVNIAVKGGDAPDYWVSDSSLQIPPSGAIVITARVFAAKTTCFYTGTEIDLPWLHESA